MSKTISEAELVFELKERVRGSHVDKVAQELNVTPEMVRGVITKTYRPGMKIAKGMGYQMSTQKFFTKK